MSEPFDLSDATLINWPAFSRFRKLPIVVDACQVNLPEGFVVETLEGRMEGKPGVYLIRGVKGELYPCDREIFEATYEALSPTPTGQKGERE